MHALRLRIYRNSRVGNGRPATGTIELDNGGPVTGMVDLQIDVRLPEQ